MAFFLSFHSPSRGLLGKGAYVDNRREGPDAALAVAGGERHMSRRERVERTEDWDLIEPRSRWDVQRAMELREAHREKVARNEVRVSPLWAQPCRAYNLHIELDARTKSSLGITQ